MRMRTAGLIVALALGTMAPVALAQTDTPAPPTQVEAVPSEATATAPAEDAAPAEEAAAEQTAARAQERVCHTIERSESRLRSRREQVCRTQAEWDAQQQGGSRGGGGNAGAVSGSNAANN
jgi:hypothetical protein